MQTAQSRGNLTALLALMAIPSQARLREGVETRRAGPKLPLGNMVKG